MTSRILRGVVGNFLGTYLSRYSDYEGYWLFGFLVPALGEMRVNLLEPPSDDRPQFQYAIDLAARRFWEQIRKGRLQAAQVRRAELMLSRDPVVVSVRVNGYESAGWVVRASVVVESSRGRRFQAEQRILVAPHDAATEFRSARAEAEMSATADVASQGEGMPYWLWFVLTMAGLHLARSCS